MSLSATWHSPVRSTGPDRQTFSRGVVLLHGIARTSRSLNKIERALQGSRFATLNLDYQSRKQPLDALAVDIHPDIARFADNIDGPVHFVAHSMGGLLARVYLAKYRPARLGRVVMLGTPNGGSEVADRLQGLGIYRTFFGPAGLQLSTAQDHTLRSLPPVDYALGIVAGCRSLDPISSIFILPRPNDGKVSVHRTRLAGMAAHTVVKARTVDSSTSYDQARMSQFRRLISVLPVEFYSAVNGSPDKVQLVPSKIAIRSVLNGV